MWAIRRKYTLSDIYIQRGTYKRLRVSNIRLIPEVSVHVRYSICFMQNCSYRLKKKKKEQLDDNFRRIRDMHSSFFILLSRISRDSQSFRKQKMRITSHTYESFVSVRYQNTFFFNQIARIWFKCSFKCDGQALPLYY